jgi:hypothetical protein
MDASNVVFFKTLKKHHIVTIKNPCVFTDRFKSGNKKGKVKSKQQIQYSKDYDTIDLIEQRKIDPKAKASPLWLDVGKGIFKIHTDDIHLLDFLRKCEQNEENGGTLFKEINVEKEELYELEGFEKFTKACSLINDAKENDLRAAAGWVLKKPNAITNSPSKIKLEMLRKCNKESFAEEVISFFEEKSNEEKLLLAVAINENIIKIIDGRKIGWFDNEEVFFVSSQANDVLKDCSLWLKTDEEGREYAKLIAEKVKDNK